MIPMVWAREADFRCLFAGLADAVRVAISFNQDSCYAPCYRLALFQRPS
jgi:hypothetical protein